MFCLMWVNFIEKEREGGEKEREREGERGGEKGKEREGSREGRQKVIDLGNKRTNRQVK